MKYSFQKGDKIRNIDGFPFSNDSEVVTVDFCYEDTSWGEKVERVRIVETGTNTKAKDVELVTPQRSKTFEEAVRELEKELAIYQERARDAMEKVDKLELTIQTLKEFDEKK